MIGYIYLCTCLSNNKHYVGQTIRACEVRWKEHIRHAKMSNCAIYECKFYRALRKYGVDGFDWKTIETVVAETKEDLQKELDRLEVEYIKKFDSYKHGYNSTIGGEHSSVEPKQVIVFSDTGEQLEVFDSALEASKFYNISVSIIRNACSRFTYYTKWDNLRLVFRWENDCITEEDFLFLQNCHYDFPVEMYDLNGNKINSFQNITEAANKFNLKNERISKSCRGESAFVQIAGKRYIFRYKGNVVTDEDLERAKAIKSDPKVAVIAIDSVTGEIIGEYCSQSDAARMLGTRKNNISEALSGKRKSAGKYNEHPIKWIKKPIL